jgi:anti-sigma-K factor RskA
MTDERHEEMAALAALDLLDPAERAAFEAAAAADPQLAPLAAQLREDASRLALAAPPATPPAGLRDRVLASAAAGRPKAGILPFPSVLLPWAAAACLAFAAAWLGRLYVATRAEAAFLRDGQALASLELRQARAELEAERIVNQRELTEARRDLADANGRISAMGTQLASLDRKLHSSESLDEYKVTTLASMVESAPRALAVAVWCPSMQEGILAVSNLPSLPAGKDYQLWVVAPGQSDPISGGVFRVDNSTGCARIIFRTARPIESIVKFAVSLERRGGVEKAEGPMILVSS